MSTEKPKLELETPPPRSTFAPVLPVDEDLTPLPGARGKGDPPPQGTSATVWLFLLGLIVFHVAANLAWLNQDNHVIRTDEEGHMLIARQYHETLFVTPYPNAIERLIAIGDIRPGNPAHPPLLSILGALMVRAFGYHPDVLSATSTVLFAFLILAVFLLARQVLRPWGALFATFVVSFTPMVFTSSRYFMTDFLAAAITVWALYALVKSRGFKHTGWVFFFALLNGLGLLTRPNTFLYYLVPAAFIFLVGLWRVASPKDDHQEGWRGLGLLALNTVVTLVVTLGVCAPWWFHHLDTFYTFWTEVHASQGPVAALPAQDVLPMAIEAAPRVLAAQVVDPQVTTSLAMKVADRFTNPGEPWLRYPVYLINNGVFLPTFVIGLLGMLCALFHPRFRGLPAFTILLWVLGSWVLMTIIFKNSTPRYAMPFAGGFTLLAALFVLSPPWRSLQGLLAALFAALLVFQYGNLTARDYGTYKALVTGISIDPTAEKRYGDDPGLVVWKDILVFGDSFSRISAPVDDNYKDLLFGAMVAEEKRSDPPGEWANYLRVRVRGMEFDERHYWPSTAESPNPYAWRAWDADKFPRRKLRSIGMGDTPQDLAGKLDGADYLVYYVKEDETALEAEWNQFLMERGFQRLYRGQMPASGSIDARFYGVYGQKTHALELTRTTIEGLSLEQLYQLQYAWGRFDMLEPELQALAKDRFQQLLAQQAAPVDLNDEVAVIPLGHRRIDANTAEFDLLFHVKQAMDRDWDILFIGKVGQNEEDLARLPESKRIQGYMDWNFTPDPPTTQWRQGDYVMVKHRVAVEPMPYFFQVGVLSPSGAPHGGAANLGWVDFSQE